MGTKKKKNLRQSHGQRENPGNKSNEVLACLIASFDYQRVSWYCMPMIWRGNMFFQSPCMVVSPWYSHYDISQWESLSYWGEGMKYSTCWLYASMTLPRYSQWLVAGDEFYSHVRLPQRNTTVKPQAWVAKAWGSPRLSKILESKRSRNWWLDHSFCFKFCHSMVFKPTMHGILNGL